MVEWLFMRDFQNAFDAALAGVDSTIVEVMGISAQFTSGAQRGGEVHGVFDDPESLGFASSGIRIEGSNPSLFVLTDTVCAVRRGDTLTINGEMFWVDRVSPDDGGVVISGSTGGNHLPPAVAAERGCMAIKGLEQAVENLSRISKTAVPGAAAMAINRVASSAISQSASLVARETKVRRKLVKERARLKRATVKNPQARIKVNRGICP